MPYLGSSLPILIWHCFSFCSNRAGASLDLHIRDFRQCFALQNCSWDLLKKWCQLCASMSNKDSCPMLSPQCCLSCSRMSFLSEICTSPLGQVSDWKQYGILVLHWWWAEPIAWDTGSSSARCGNVYLYFITIPFSQDCLLHKLIHENVNSLFCHF